MNENEPRGSARLEEAFRRYDTFYLQKYPPARPPVSKRLLTALLAAAFLVCATLGISAVKEPLSDFAVKIYREFVEFFFDEEIPAPDETEYTLSSLPSGYSLLSEYRGANEYKRIWGNESGEVIMLLQLPLDAKITLDYENSEQKHLDVNGIPTICFEKNDKRIYYLQTKTNVLTLTVPSSFSEEECMALLDSLRLDSH